MIGDGQNAERSITKPSLPSALSSEARDAVREAHSRGSILALPSATLDVLKEEQKQRRSEIDALMLRFDEDQRYGLAITGAVWTWFATNIDKVPAPLLYVAAFVPAAIMVFFLWRRSAIASSLQRSAAYVLRLEEAFGVPEALGWERWLAKTFGSSSLSRATRVFWYALVLLNLALALLFASFR
jgi:hypothetical protein